MIKLELNERQAVLLRKAVQNADDRCNLDECTEMYELEDFVEYEVDRQFDVLDKTNGDTIAESDQVAIDRARFERLLEYVNLAVLLGGEEQGSLMFSARLGELRRALKNRKPGDLDPIP